MTSRGRGLNGPLLRKLAAGAAIASASLLAAFLLSRLPLAKTYEWKLYDLEFRQLANRPDLANRNIVMVKIDDLSVQQMADSGFGRFPWARDTYGVLLDYFERSRPKVVSFDIIFPEEDSRTAPRPAPCR